MKTFRQESNPLEAYGSFSAGPPILAYHQIASDTTSAGRSAYVMPIDQFERQMQYLHERGYRCLTLTDLLQASNQGATFLEKTFALTFDDGYEDFLTNAYPVLQRYGFTATVFLVAACVGRKSRWDGAPEACLLTWEQVRTLRDAGVVFGSHTYTHAHLPALSSKQIKHELLTSKDYLETRLDEYISFLAYPYGQSNRTTRRIAMEVGYAVAFGVVTGRNGQFNVWRRPCESQDTLQTFRFKLTRWYGYFLQMLRWAREDTLAGRSLRDIRNRRLAQ